MKTKHIVLNDGTPTFMRNEHTSALDIADVPADGLPECTCCALAMTFSDYLPTLTSIECHSGTSKKHERVQWNFELADWDGFKGIVELLVWNLPERDWSNHSLDSLNKRLTLCLRQAAQMHIPRGTLNGKPWWSMEIIQAVQDRQKAFNAYKKNPSKESLAVLLSTKIYTEHPIIDAKRRCWRDLAENVETDTESFRLLRVLHKTTKSTATVLSDCAKADQEIANDVVRSYVRKNRNKTRSDKYYIRPYKTYIRPTPLTSEELSIRELEATIRALSSRKAPGLDGIESMFLKQIGPKAKHLLLYICNTSWATARTPASWRQTAMIGIPKPADPLSLRAIDLSSFIARTADRLVNLRLAPIVYKYVPACQAGFCPRRSTDEQLATMVQRSADARSWKAKCAALFTDFSAAYDKVVIPALLHKLVLLRVNASLVAWLKNYLTDRRARGRLNCIGRSYVLGCRLPQGGSPSPLLWNLYIYMYI